MDDDPSRPTGPGSSPPPGPTYQDNSLADLIAAAEDSVKGALAGARGLRHFLGSIDKLSPDERKLIVEQAICLLESFYAHLPLKRAMHAVDPVQRLKLLQHRLGQVDSEIQFHHEITEIFTSLRDLHTNYLLPSYFGEVVAFLPFRVKHCYVAGERKYVVSEVMSGISDPNFLPGVEITYWNAVPIDRAIEIAASYHAGSNEAARHVRGVDGLTTRALLMSPPPDEEWVIVGYRDAQGVDREMRAEWTVMNLPPEDGTVAGASAEAQASIGLDLEGDTRRRITAILFAQNVIAEKQRINRVREEARSKSDATESVELESAMVQGAEQAVGGLDSVMPDIFNTRVVAAAGKTYGYLRIRTFNVPDDKAFVNEVIRLIERPEMPTSGLILDVRGNGGGLIWAGERLLQLFTPRTVEPTRAQFIATGMAVGLCNASAALAPWRESMNRAVETGATYSAAFPITDPARCNDVGQRYYGPVVLLTDARCYSTTDMFTAGFKDHVIGPILGVDDNTGAGGANVWTLDLLRTYLQQAGIANPLQPLPRQAGMRVAIRRTLRVSGAEIEDLGVSPDRVHQPTYADVMQGDVDLLNEACALLAAQTARSLQAAPARNGGDVTVEVTCAGMDRIDAYAGDRPAGSVDVVGGAAHLAFPAPAGAPILLRGFDGAALVACRRFSI